LKFELIRVIIIS